MQWKVFDQTIGNQLTTFGWPGWNDLQQSQFYADHNAIDTILSRLATDKLHLLMGPEGRGKSILSSLVAFQSFLSKHPVYIVFSPAPGDEPNHLAAAMAARNGTSPLWIFEDCHASTHPLAALKDVSSKLDRTQLLFVFRAVSRAELPKEWPFDVLRTPKTTTFLQTDAQLVQAVIAKHLERHGLAASGQAQFNRLTEEDVTWALDTTGGDLRTLKSFLDVWDPGKCALRELQIDRVYDRLIATKLKPLVKMPQHLNAYVSLCAIFQFDVPVLGDATEIGSLEGLVELGFIGRSGKNIYILPHTSDARLTVAAYCRMMKTNRSGFISECIRQYFSPRLPTHEAVICLRGLAKNSASVSFEISEGLRQELGSRAIETGKAMVAAQYVESFCKDKTDLRKWLKELKKPRLRALLERSTMRDFYALVLAVKRIDSNAAEQLDDQLSLDQRISLYARSHLRFLSKSLHHYYRIKNSSYFSNRILAETLKTRFDERVRRSSFRSTGRFLDIAHEINPELARGAALIIAENVELVPTTNAEELSLLLANIRFDDAAWSRLITRMVSKQTPSSLFKSNPKGYSYLLNGIAECGSKCTASEEDRRRFFEVFILEFKPEMLPEIGHKQLNWIIWSFLLIGQDPTSWLKSSMPDLVDFFLRGDQREIFWLGWNLVQLSEDLFREFVNAAHLNLFPHRGEDFKGYSLALIGLLQFVGRKSELEQAVDADTVVRELVEEKSPVRIIFTLFGLRITRLNTYEATVFELQSKWANIKHHLTELIATNPIPRSRQLLADVLNGLFPS